MFQKCSIIIRCGESVLTTNFDDIRQNYNKNLKVDSRSTTTSVNGCDSTPQSPEQDRSLGTPEFES